MGLTDKVRGEGGMEKEELSLKTAGRASHAFQDHKTRQASRHQDWAPKSDSLQIQLPDDGYKLSTTKSEQTMPVLPVCLPACHVAKEMSLVPHCFLHVQCCIDYTDA